MCGRFTDASHSAGNGRAIVAACAPRASGSEGWLGGSASIQPVEVRCDTATTPDRARLEMWLMPWNGSQGCSGFASAMAEIDTAQKASSASEIFRLTRNGSVRQSTHSAGTATSAASSSGIFRRGNTDSRKEKVSRSMIRKSRKVSESCRMSNLKREHRISTTVSISESAAAMPGRGSNSSTRQLANSQASSDSVIAKGPYSVESSAVERRQMQRGDQPMPIACRQLQTRPAAFPLQLCRSAMTFAVAKGSSQSPLRSAGD